MGSLTRTFGTDESKESDGVWFTILTNDDGSKAQMKVRRMSLQNKKFMKIVSSRNRKRRQVSKNDLEDTMEAFVDGCLVDWKNIENINEPLPGQTAETYMPFNRDNALKLFKALPDLYELVLDESNNLAAFQNEENENAAKN